MGIWCSGDEALSQMLNSLSKRLGGNGAAPLLGMVIGFEFTRPKGGVLDINCPIEGCSSVSGSCSSVLNRSNK